MRSVASVPTLGDTFLGFIMPSRATIKEYMLASLAGRLPPAPTVRSAPPNKDDFPKILALDCNKWIALGQSHYGRKGAEPAARAALDAIRAATASGRLIVPMHEINALETARVDNAERRERLAAFMVALSENHCFRPTRTIGNAEKRAAVVSVYLGRVATPVRPRIVGYGLDALFGGEDSEVIRRAKSIDALLGFPGVMDALRAAPQQTVDFIVHTMRRNDAMARDREREARAATTIQSSRDVDAHLSERERGRINMLNLWDHNSTDAVREELRASGEDLERFRAWLEDGDNVFTFWDAVPSQRVLRVLEMKAGRNQQRRLVDNVNDVRDISFYKLALPYANIVVTENHWASTIRQAKLGHAYGTRILTKLAELPDALKAEGCL